MRIPCILYGGLMLFTLLALGCSEPEPAPISPRWPRAGVEAVLEVSAQVDEAGRATGWSAAAWGGRPPTAGPLAGECDAVAPRTEVEGLAAVDITAPVAARLRPNGGRGMLASGPLAVRDARWAVGDVALLGEDGGTTLLAGVLRFGDAVALTSVVVLSGGETLVRIKPQADTAVEIDVTLSDGNLLRCAGTADGAVALPAGLADGVPVVVRGVHDSVVVAPNAALLRVRAVVERVLSLADPVASDHEVLPPPGAAGSWSPRRVLRYRASLG
jgi:hypothetical protein